MHKGMAMDPHLKEFIMYFRKQSQERNSRAYYDYSWLCSVPQSPWYDLAGCSVRPHVNPTQPSYPSALRLMRPALTWWGPSWVGVGSWGWGYLCEEETILNGRIYTEWWCWWWSQHSSQTRIFLDLLWDFSQPNQSQKLALIPVDQDLLSSLLSNSTDPEETWVIGKKNLSCGFKCQWVPFRVKSDNLQLWMCLFHKCVQRIFF